MNLADKVEYINKFVNDKFSVTKYGEYEFVPFDDGIFSCHGKYKSTRAETFERLMVIVYDLIKEEENKELTLEEITVNGKKYQLVKEIQNEDEIPF